jgi:hypothetical protein
MVLWCRVTCAFVNPGPHIRDVYVPCAHIAIKEVCGRRPDCIGGDLLLLAGTGGHCRHVMLCRGARVGK